MPIAEPTRRGVQIAGAPTLAEGKWPKPPPKNLGRLVTETAHRIQTYPGLVDVDAGKLRNAIAHRQAKYLPLRRSVEFCDRDGLWKRTLSLRELEARLDAMWHVAYTLTSEIRPLVVANMYYRSGAFSALLLIRDAHRGDAAAMKALADRDPGADLDIQFVRRSPPPGTNLWFFQQM